MQKNNQYQITIIRPGGNDQLLVKGLVEDSKQLANNLFRVDLEGIVHLIYDRSTQGFTNDAIKDYAKEILEKENLLLSTPAAGVMFIEQSNKELSIKPIVWVRDIQTLLYETSCASGTAAVGLWNYYLNNISTMQVKQPSKKYIEVTINKRNTCNIEVSGEVEIIKNTRITL